MQIKNRACAWLAYIKTMKSSHWVVDACGAPLVVLSVGRYSLRASGVTGLISSAVTEYLRLGDV